MLDLFEQAVLLLIGGGGTAKRSFRRKARGNEKGHAGIQYARSSPLVGDSDVYKDDKHFHAVNTNHMTCNSCKIPSSRLTSGQLQPRLSRVKGWSSPARGYKFACVCSYMAGHEDAGVMTGHIGTNTPKFAPCRQGRPPSDPTQTGLCKFGCVWSALKICTVWRRNRTGTGNCNVGTFCQEATPEPGTVHKP